MLRNQPDLKIVRNPTMFISSRRHCMDWSKHLELGMRGWGTSDSLRIQDGKGWYNTLHKKDWKGFVCVPNLCGWHYLWINKLRFLWGVWRDDGSRVWDVHDWRAKLLPWTSNQANKEWYICESRQVDKGYAQEVWDARFKTNPHTNGNKWSFGFGYKWWDSWPKAILVYWPVCWLVLVLVWTG